MRFKVYRARRGLLRRNQWRWTLFADNNKKIAESGESYNNRGDALKAIELVQRSGSAAVVGAGL